MKNWTQGEKEVLRSDNEARVPRAETARKLGRSVASVESYASYLGLTFPPRRGDPVFVSPEEALKLRERWELAYPRVRDAFLADISQDVA